LPTLAKRAGLAKSAVWNAEQGQNLTLRVLFKICAQLDVSPSFILE